LRENGSGATLPGRTAEIHDERVACPLLPKEISNELEELDDLIRDRLEEGSRAHQAVPGLGLGGGSTTFARSFDGGSSSSGPSEAM
jgi:hypothetical protein